MKTAPLTLLKATGRVVFCLFVLGIGFFRAAEFSRYGLVVQSMPLIATGTIACVVVIAGLKGFLVALLVYLFSAVGFILGALFGLSFPTSPSRPTDVEFFVACGVIGGTGIGLYFARRLNIQRNLQ